MSVDRALDIEGVSHNYGEHQALRNLDLSVETGEIFAILGPNGSGKTTLFRLISTLARLASGDIRVFGQSVRANINAVRSLIGVVFQAPSLDKKLTAIENMFCQAALYGLSGSLLRQRIDALVQQLGIADRLSSRVEALSGGLKRRVELVKGLLHHPRLLLLDEPSTGLDPAARLDLWHALDEMRQRYGVTVVLTTHLLEEAEKADRIAILHAGKCVAVDSPTRLRSELGEQILTIQASEPERILAWLGERSIAAEQVQMQIRVSGDRAAQIIAPLAKECDPWIESLTLGRPSLEDVFIARTGHRFWNPQMQITT